MNHTITSIRPFIGAKDFKISRQFYGDLGFDEHILGPGFSLFIFKGIGFYLQDAYVRDWIDNTMIFLEVDDADRYYKELTALQLPDRYENVRVIPVREYEWGKECFLHDPSGILWHFGEFFPEK